MTYEEIITQCPPGGTGVHSWMMSVANIGARQDIPADDVQRDILANMTRPQTGGNEVSKTIEKAYREKGHRVEVPNQTAEERALQREQIEKIKARSFIRLAGREASVRELMRLSPAKVDPGPGYEAQMAAMLIARLFDRDEIIWCGGLYESLSGIDTAENWAQKFLCLDIPPPFFIPNPLTGFQGSTKSGDDSYRADSCIEDWRFALFEVDLPEVTLGHQAAFWIRMIESGEMPVEAITYSGGKSLHALIRVDCQSEMQWDKLVRNGAFPEWIKIGADKMCRNPARLSRLPGHNRTGGKMQKLLWLRGGK